MGARPYLRCEKALWDELTQAMARAGINQLVIDLGDAVRYESHPEIAVEGAWSVDALRAELTRLRGLGLEPIPKLNFATTHDVWLGEYSRMVSTPTYYRVVSDLIGEVCQLFDSPRLFHLGMDEEGLPCQREYEYVVIRQHNLWWRDLAFYCNECEKRGARPWVWADHLWHYPETYLEKMPRSVLQSNWHYDRPPLDPENRGVKAYRQLEAHGYDQIPTGSNWSSPENFGATVAYARETIASERLLGFLQTVWRPTMPAYRERHLAAIEQAGAARQAFSPG